jgi:hypothetical protein
MIHHDDTKTPVERRSVRVKPWWLIAAAVCLLGGLTLSFTIVDPPAYHWWQYKRLKSRALSDHSTTLGAVEEALFGDHWSRYRGHLQSLVDAGEVDLLKIDLNHCLNTQAEHNSLCDILLNGSRRETIVDWSIPSGSGKPGETLACEVWCRPEHAEDWRAFFDEYNTSPNAAIPRNNKDAE